MKLVAGIPESLEYPVKLNVSPRAPKPGQPIQLRFRVEHPTKRSLSTLQIIHEKLFHLFLVSGDLQYFAHEHPQQQQDGSFLWKGALPRAGEYRALCDFYPEGGTPQMIAKTLILPGNRETANLLPDIGTQTGVNLRVSLRTEPVQPLAGQKTSLFFKLDPEDGLEPYLGAWGHMLAASSDLIDMIHNHPAFEERGSQIQFNLIFPRPGVHRLWVQFQRNGIVNTIAFNVPVKAL